MSPERDPNEVPIGPVLRSVREGAGMSRRSLAKAARVDHTHLSRVETGERTLSPDLLAKVLGAIARRLHHQDDAA